MTSAKALEDIGSATTDRPALHLCVHADDQEPTERLTVTARDGSRAELVGAGDDERLVLRDHDERVLFEYEPGTARCVVHVPAGDLVLKADAGSIELDASHAIRLRAGLLEGTFHRVFQKVDVLETAAGRVVERARETYREVEELAQLRAGRVRQVAEKTYHVMGARTLFKARRDVKIKGDTIHLG